MEVLIGVEDSRKMTLGYAEALRDEGYYMEMDTDGFVWIYGEHRDAK
jgi:hypothetical protein